MKKLLPLAAAAAVIFSASHAAAAPRTLNTCTTITEPGAYVVGRNLDATGNCFVIATDFVNLDFDGMVIRGNGSGAGVSQTLVSGAGRRGIVLRNGVITGFVHGVALDDAVGVRAENMTVSGNSGFGLQLGDSAAAIGNTVTHNQDGIVLRIRGLAKGNNVGSNANVGIHAGPGANITSNTVGQNGASGIFTAEGALVSGNVSRSNGQAGISADCPSLVIGNTSSNNSGPNLFTSSGVCDPDSASCCVGSVHNMLN